MVKRQLLRRGIVDSKVIKAMGIVPREKFVPLELREYAYDDWPLTIGFGQTISQPYVVALMCQLLKLKGGEKVLDVGTGSGYQAAILSLLAKQVISIERFSRLAQAAKNRLEKLGYSNVEVIIGDGTKGLAKEAPFDAIVCGAAASVIPKAWKEQLRNGGRIVLPLKKSWGQELVRVTKKAGRFFEESFGSVAFVPLVPGKES